MIGVAQNAAEAEKGRKAAEADQRVYVQEREAVAIGGENTSRANIARSNAELAIEQATANQRALVARNEAEVQIQLAQAKAERERLVASEVVRQEIEKRKIEIAAAAEAEQARLLAAGEADAALAKYNAEAEGVRKILEGKAEGYQRLVSSCGGDAKAAASLLMIEKLEQIVGLQVEAIRNLKIDKVTVWDSGSGAGGESSTAKFASSLIGSLPPLHEVAKMAGLDLPEYLGTTRPERAAPPAGAPTP